MASSSSQSPTPIDDTQSENAPVRTKRRYGASCELCRRRKRKCPGRDEKGNSLCTHCGEVGVKCVFPPNGSFLRAKKAVAVVSSISATPDAESLRAYIHHLASANEEERQRLLNQWLDNHGSPSGSKDAASMRKFDSRPTRTASVNSAGEDDHHEEHKLARSRPSSTKNPRPFKKPRLWTDSGQRTDDLEDDEDEDGQSTEKSLRPESALRLSLKPATPDDSESTGEDDPPVDKSIQSTTTLQANISAWVDYWIGYSFPDGILADGPTTKDRQLLFDNYFCWQGPRNGIVDRAILERALEENDSKYYSNFLLYAICAHTVRHIPQLRDRVHEYAGKAHYLLAAELSRPSSIPTIQGLMLLASHDAARGMYAQAWNLTSTAVAMMMDLGCHLDKPSTPSDRNDPQREQRIATQKQMRSRIFWSSFIWDKLISLALNRTPLLNSEEHTPPLPDPVYSSEPWVPVLCTDSPPALFSYVPQPSHELKCFYETCRANQFLDEIHRNLYRNPKVRSPEAHEFVADMQQRMRQWQEEACPEVMIDLSVPLLHPPPPHIMQLNLLVRLMWILLYRPFFYSSSSAENLPSFVDDAVPVCARAAIEINSIFTMYDRFYPLSRASYIVIFAGFLQATVDLALADREKSVSGATLSRLALAGRVLSGGSANIPGMHSSVRCLQEHLHATLSRCNSWVPSSKSHQGPEQLRLKNQTISPSPPMSNQHSSASPPDSQPDHSPKVASSISMSPVSMHPSTHSSEDAELTPLSPRYPVLPHTRSSSSIDSNAMSLSPSEPISYTVPMSRPDYHLPDSVYGAQISYAPQTPDHEMIDYMTGSQLSHYESGWNAWFWPGEGSGSTFGPGASGNMVQNPHITAM
ncbi:fungal-specific transcription factor domain-containing protein [Rhodocollybia butyracea]|uniref:Fungal-specific transcription factor domain-containing protein n=1 Tax=Rhodocollybia butyracea TaxID=206335 RepID=A0A9P5U9J2_9AGAR|nr:fungal-specific transcription factor domain-containing protein [Rhodocollybia butyracea]